MLISLVIERPSFIFSCETKELNCEDVVPEMVTTTTSVGSGVAEHELVLVGVAVGVTVGVLGGEPLLVRALIIASIAPTDK